MRRAGQRDDSRQVRRSGESAFSGEVRIRRGAALGQDATGARQTLTGIALIRGMPV